MMRFATLLAFLIGCAADATPEDAARVWFSAAASGNDARMAQVLDPRCADAPVGQGAPSHIMGMSVDVEDLDLVTTRLEGNEATVAYSFRGEIHKPRETHEEVVGGTEVTVTTPSHDVDMGGKSGTLSLVRWDGEWKVTCTFAGLRTP